MKVMLHVSALVMVGVCATWAYRVNYATQEAASRLADLRREVAAEREALAMAEAEWAYVNRPDRLRALVNANPGLGLVPLSPEQFAAVEDIPFPPEPEPVTVADAPPPRAGARPAPTPAAHPGAIR